MAGGRTRAVPGDSRFTVDSISARHWPCGAARRQAL